MATATVVVEVVEGQKLVLVARGERGCVVMGKLFYHQTTFIPSGPGDRRTKLFMGSFLQTITRVLLDLDFLY